MCFDHDSRPPIAPIAGGALDGSLVTLTADDGNALAAFRARPAEPTGAGVVILPDVRGLYPFYEELALRFAERGVDAVPVVYAVDGGYVGVPIDRVKPKVSSRLQRERNLEADPRAMLLIDHWDRDDWSRLWWVRAQLRWEDVAARAAALAGRLGERYRQYRDQPFDRVLVLRIARVTGWAAAE